MWVIVGTVIGAIGAIAALATIWYARETVLDTRASRLEGHQEHEAELAELRQMLEAFTAARADADRQHTAAMGQQQAALDATVKAHQEQQAVQAHALDTQVRLQRLHLMGRLADVLADLAEVCRFEATTPELLTHSNGRPVTRIPQIRSQLQVTLRLLAAAGGPTFPEVDEVTNDYGSNAVGLMSKALTALGSLQARLGEDQPAYAQLKVEEAQPVSTVEA